jgi:hypothetical protein
VLLERDDDFPPAGELEGELRAIRETVRAGAATVRGGGAGLRTGLAAVRGGGLGPRTGLAAVPGAARTRLGEAQHALLAALVAGGPPPGGFDAERLAVQADALAGKRGQVVAKVAPELPLLLGGRYRTAFRAYASAHPLTGGYRRDALGFAAHILEHADPPLPRRTRRALTRWYTDRSGPVPPRRGPRRRLGKRLAG